MQTTRFIYLPGLSTLCVAVTIVIAFASAGAAADVRTGEQIYRKECVSCHGAAGEGAKAYPQPLVGNKSIAALAKLIAKTMPDNDPGSLSKEDADKVAAYVHDTFYSRAAREGNKPPHVELSRLTVGQYRNAVADLIGGFRGAGGKWEDKHGLHGEYFSGRGFNKRIIDRTDPEVNFNFGSTGPEPDKFDPAQFSIRWEGSLLAPETGEYEFIVNTEHALRLWVNDNKQPLIDAWVKSGSDTEFRGSLFLLGGRAYPLRLEFSKAKQGVDDSKKIKDKPQVNASIALLWKLPKRTAEIIPARNLSPNRVPETFVVTTPFPPDDRSLGWERGSTISKAWDQAATDAALETASYVSTRLNDLAGTKEGAPDRDAKVRDFSKKFAAAAFRRPLTDDQKNLFVDRQFEGAKEAEAAVKRVVLLVLKSPRFLYREVAGGPDGYDTACRLAFALWDAPPDAELLKAAVEGKLNSRDQIAKQAERMLADPRARAKLHGFFLKWLKIDQVSDIAKDPKRYEGFDAAIASDLRTSLEMFLDGVIWSDASDFRQLLLADYLYVNGRLAKFYGAELPDVPTFRRTKLNADQRAGVLTHPYLMAAFAYTGSTSPIHRGVFIGRGILGVSLRPPPEAFTPLPENMHPNLTTRERVALQTRPAACVSCHSVINPLGFTLEHFDAVGRYRETENDKPVDASGAYQTRAGDTVRFDGIRDLAKFLADSEEVHSAFIEQMFHHLVRQPVLAYGPRTLPELRQSFANSDFNIRKLAVEIAVLAAMPAVKTQSK
jgi:cytochrome c553